MFENVNGEQVEFPMLSLKDLESLEEQVRLRQREDAERALKSCELKGTDKFLMLAKIRPDDVSLGSVYVHLETAGGIRKALSLSLDKTALAAEKKLTVIDSFDPADASNLAKSLLGMTMRVKLPSVTEEQSGPLSETSGSASS
jgi:hypothetical protein